MTKRRRPFGGSKRERALVPVRSNTALPQIYLPETKGNLPEVFLSEPGASDAGARVKWLASTCLAALVGVGLIGGTVYASLNLDDGSGVVSSLKRAGLAAMEPQQSVHVAEEEQSVRTRKSDRIETASRGLSTRDIIHDTVVQQRGGREYIKVKPYGRITATLSTGQPAQDKTEIPPFNPFKLYADLAPITDGSGNKKDAGERVSIEVIELNDGHLPDDDGLELRTNDIVKLVAESTETFAPEPFAMRDTISNQPAAENPLVHRAAYHPNDLKSPDLVERAVPRRTTVVEKSPVDIEEEVLEGIRVEATKVRRGDTLMGILAKTGAERWQAKQISEAMAPVFPVKRLRSGQEVRFTLAPAPSDVEKMEPIKISIFSGTKHLVTVARNEAGDYTASNDPIELGGAVVAMRSSKHSRRATLYTSIYMAAMAQKIPADMITKLLKIHAYDSDYKQRVRSGDSFEVFFDMHEEKDAEAGAPSELLYTSLTVDGETRRFYRFRTPEGIVDYYDPQGNSAKKFLMRKPVKGARFTSGFGMRKHPLLRYRKMHTGVDFAAPRGTPILAAGHGTVEAVGRKGGYGNYVRIRHANGYKTAYSHLHRFARGMRPGVKVKQGQVIGYVGSTGLSSGPHLHYEVLVNKRFVNPMKIHVPRGQKLTGRLLAAFQKERLRIDALKQRSPVTTRYASLDN